MDTRAHFVMLARYNVWATGRLLDALAPLGDDDYRRDLGLFFRSIHGTLNHLLVGERMLWFRRFAEGVSPQVRLNEEVEHDRAELARRLLEGAAHWQPLIAGWPAERFEGELAYTGADGSQVSLPFAATLAHVFSHGAHHRGQISATLAMLGQPVPELDLITMLQEEQDTP